MSGHFNCFTMKAAEAWLVRVFGEGAKDYTLQQGVHPDDREKLKSKDFKVRVSVRWGYVVTDSYRPGFVYWGKTPKASLEAAGLTVLR